MRDAHFLCVCRVSRNSPFPRNPIFILCPGQRIVARLRERTYAATLRQEVEFVERGEGDALSRLSVDSSIVGER
jgi:hypothetical protein